MRENPRISTETVDTYIQKCPEEIRTTLQMLRDVIRSAAPGAQEKISYGIPTYFLNGNLVHFAAFKSHIGFYPTPSAIAHFQQELLPWVRAKGTVEFPLDTALPWELIRRMVEYRVRENTCGKE